MSIPRADEQGFRWAEEIVGGRIVQKRKHNRWRPQWFLDLERPDGTLARVILRGFRNPGYTAVDEPGVRHWFHIESEILRTLQSLPIKVPRHLGYDHEMGWMLMEHIDGIAEVSDVEDPEQRFRAFRGYMEELAKLHAISLEKIALSPTIPNPGTVASHLQRMIREHIAFYRRLQRPEPEPILEIGIQWVLEHKLPSERPLALGLGDVGPGQFLFEGSEFRSMIDFEYGMVADPFMEIGMMRNREMQYPLGRMAEHILHYGECYEKLSGHRFDIDAVRYWSVAGATLWNLFSNAGIQKQDPAMIDLVFLLAWETQQKRALVEAMAECHGLRLEKPALPASRSSLLGPLHETMTGQFEHYYAKRARDPAEEAFTQYSAALSATLARGNATLGDIDRANLDELAPLIGRRAEDWYEGLFALEDMIRADYGRDFEARLQFLYNLSYRREYLYEPMMRATGCGSFVPLDRFDDLPGIEPSRVPLPRSKHAVGAAA